MHVGKLMLKQFTSADTANINGWRALVRSLLLE